MVVFPLVKQLKGNPVEIGTKIGTFLTENVDLVSKFNVVQGFLNIVIDDKYYTQFFNGILNDETFGFSTQKENEKAVMRSEEHTSELQSRETLVCSLLLEKK